MWKLKIGQRWIGEGEPVYFVADISANHDGDLERAKMLINLAAGCGADAAKFQNFRAKKIVSKYGFSMLVNQVSHQAKWKKSIYQAYEDAELPWEWTPILKAQCDAAGIDFLSTPYDLEAVDMLAAAAPVFKIGSGDITWLELLQKVARQGKPVMLATGASNPCDVQRAVLTIQRINQQLVLMQCNTNYTGDVRNFEHINLNVLKTYRVMFPSVLLGLSDHTFGHATVLGAVALGACVIEKHFTDDRSREGPDHSFSMTPTTWQDMIGRTRELEKALGSPVKKVADNEQGTVVVQRRCLRAARDLKAGEALIRDMLDVLRPAPRSAIFPYEFYKVLGMRLRIDVPAGHCLNWRMFGES